MEREKFDPKLARVDVAIKALFLLWKRARWEILLFLFPGLSRAEVNTGFQRFDETLDGNRIKTEAQVFQLIKTFPRVADAAIVLVGTYQILYMEAA